MQRLIRFTQIQPKNIRTRGKVTDQELWNFKQEKKKKKREYIGPGRPMGSGRPSKPAACAGARDLKSRIWPVAQHGQDEAQHGAGDSHLQPRVHGEHQQKPRKGGGLWAHHTARGSTKLGETDPLPKLY